MNNTSYTAVLMSGLNVCDCADSKRCVCWSSGALRVQTVCLSVVGIRTTAVLNHSSRRIYTHQDIEVLRSVVFNVVMLYLTSLTCVNPCVDVVLSPALHACQKSICIKMKATKALNILLCTREVLIINH